MTGHNACLIASALLWVCLVSLFIKLMWHEVTHNSEGKK